MALATPDWRLRRTVIFRNWTDEEKKKLGDVEEMGKIIKSRLENVGCEIQELHTIKHDKDKKRWWNERKKEYELHFKSNHAHFVIKFQKGKGKTLPELASSIGIGENYIEKPKSGGHSYDNMLSYLIHEPDEWLEQFNTFSIYQILPELINLWGLNVQQQVDSKKNLIAVSGK